MMTIENSWSHDLAASSGRKAQPKAPIFFTAKLHQFAHKVQTAQARLVRHAPSTTWEASNFGGMLSVLLNS